MLMSPVAFSPQSASSIDLEHSGAASAIETEVGLEAPTISATIAKLDNRITGSSICDPLTSALPRRRALLSNRPQCQWAAPVLVATVIAGRRSHRH
ncbi:bsr5197 [Bradyrhizobium diazoefficiens USDA 110]|uniref:Bsr5197 protein n=1 Tax=Bradyrhizobium diazoefficiens (strain JCM 10833 / BCRC 13528 / IAM 13628 / NBRC 14792 / USDA 110) TaxID=224911 RepID=Q89JS5_BRADU|nr:hypothetical protein CO678_27125 [Bradyrhizobium diazoefficiens]QBP27231.1 hypothetical protein Bdiaspc4_27340 [Bradyrhizobium diazoefficiens]BAC50462.1 bsr5197 [Bradyrhizobium diazoefficiens USDA 110]